MGELVAFLRARIAEDEQSASTATQGPWSVDDPEYPVVIYGGGNWTPVVSGGRWGGEAPVFESGEDANHIVRHDPARVLAEVDAKKRLLTQFELRGNSVRRTVKPATGGVWDDLLRILALPYASHPDYREEWRL